MDQPRVFAVGRSGRYTFGKPTRDSITLIAGLGVEGDVHAGVTVRHRSRMAHDPSQPNLRQVHLIHAELYEGLRAQGYAVAAGQLGENVTTAGLDVLGLPTGALLRLGPQAVVEVTGLRHPCVQINGVADRMLRAVMFRDEHGDVVRLAGIMGVVRSGGVVRPGDPIGVEPPSGPHRRLEPV